MINYLVAYAQSNSDRTVPWADILARTQGFIISSFHPPSVPLKEPKNLTTAERFSLAHCILEHQENHPNDPYILFSNRAPPKDARKEDKSDSGEDDNENEENGDGDEDGDSDEEFGGFPELGHTLGSKEEVEELPLIRRRLARRRSHSRIEEDGEDGSSESGEHAGENGGQERAQSELQDTPKVNRASSVDRRIISPEDEDEMDENMPLEGLYIVISL